MSILVLLVSIAAISSLHLNVLLVSLVSVVSIVSQVFTGLFHRSERIQSHNLVIYGLLDCSRIVLELTGQKEPKKSME